MLAVKVREGEPFEKAIRRFTTECNKSRIVKRCRERAYYVSPSERMHTIKVKKRKYGSE
ncbi:30S ribosomal protein S21 [bacterium]|nr:30S ribosomal protein S21 [bacterium]